MLDLRTAMLRVLNRFPAALYAATEMFRELRRIAENPNWAQEGG